MNFKAKFLLNNMIFFFRDVHRYIVDNGVVKIKQHLEKLRKETSDLKL